MKHNDNVELDSSRAGGREPALPTDKQLLDYLEAEIKIRPLILWTGYGEFPGGPRGLGLLSRSLREAITAMMRYDVRLAVAERPTQLPSSGQDDALRTQKLKA